MNALWSPERRARLNRAVRGASKAFGDADVQRLSERVVTWTDAWVLSSAEVRAARRAAHLSDEELLASEACLAVERVEYAALLDGLNQGCKQPGCQAERVSNLDWQLIAAEQSTRACTQPAFFQAYLSSNLAAPEAVDTQGKLLALEELGEDQRLARQLAAALARHSTPSPFHTRLLLLEARRIIRTEANPERAIALLDQGLAEAQARGDALEVAALRDARSDANDELGRLPEARQDAALAAQHTVHALGPGHVQTALTHANFAAVLLSSSSSAIPPDLDAAQRALEGARRTLTRALGPTHPLTARVELALGQVTAGQGDAAASQRWLTRGTSSTAVAFGAQHLAMSDAVLCNAKVESGLGAPKTSLSLFKRALELQERILGAIHPRVARTRFDVGLAYRTAGAYQASVRSLEQAVSIRARLGLRKTNTGARLWNELGVSQQLAKQPASALSSYLRSLALYRQLYGDDHPEVVSLRYAASGVRIALGEYALAERDAREVLATLQRTGSTDRELWANTYRALGWLRQHQGDPEPALTWFRKALEIRDAHASVSPFDLVVALIDVGSVQLALDQLEGAKQHAERAEELLRRLPEHQRDQLQRDVCWLIGKTHESLKLAPAQVPSCRAHRD